MSSVRNCAKLLETWLDYHRSIGITRFYLIDHQPSQDETSEILARQSREMGDLVVVKKRGPFMETRWSAELCNLALRDGASALFPNDVDEFLVGNGAPFREVAERVIADLELTAEEGRHYTSPGFNMFPSVDRGDDEDFRSHVLCRPNPLFVGKSAVFFRSAEDQPMLQFDDVRRRVVTNGCQHRLTFRPPLPPLISPGSGAAVPLSAVSPSLDYFCPRMFPFMYLHFPFHGPSCFIHRIRTFVAGPRDKVLQMAIRYGKGLVDEARRTSRQLSDADLQSFVEQIRGASPALAQKIYRDAVLSAGLPRAHSIKTDLASFCGLDQPQAQLRSSLDSFGSSGEQPPMTREEFLMWPVGALEMSGCRPSSGEAHEVLEE